MILGGRVVWRWWLLALGCSAAGCGESPRVVTMPAQPPLASSSAALSTPGASALALQATATSVTAASSSGSVAPIASRPAVSPAGKPFESQSFACQVAARVPLSPRDARSEAALHDCRFEVGPDARIANDCGQDNTPLPKQLAALAKAVPPLSPEVAQHTAATMKRGQTQGRDAQTFAVTGDSFSSPKFLTPLATNAVLSPALSEALLVGRDSLVERIRQHRSAAGPSCFNAPKAAKVGAPLSWAFSPKVDFAQTEVGKLVRRLSPAIMLVLFGTNDAGQRRDNLAQLQRRYRVRLEALVDELEARGIVPVLHTIPRRMHSATLPDCPAVAATANAGANPGASSWDAAVAVNALSHVAAQVACERKLPLLDLRAGFDTLRNHGIGLDGIHPNAHRSGAGLLTQAGLQCGYNVRNYLTLRMLKHLAEVRRAQE